MFTAPNRKSIQKILEISCHYCVWMVDPVHRVVRVPEQRVGETGLEEVHRKEGGDSDDLVKENVDALPVPDVLAGPLLAQPQEAGGGQGKELLEPVLDVVMTTDAEQAAKQLVDGRGQAVDVVTVTLQLSLGRSSVLFFIIHRRTRILFVVNVFVYYGGCSQDFTWRSNLAK